MGRGLLEGDHTDACLLRRSVRQTVHTSSRQLHEKAVGESSCAAAVLFRLIGRSRSQCSSISGGFLVGSWTSWGDSPFPGSHRDSDKASLTGLSRLLHTCQPPYVSEDGRVGEDARTWTASGPTTETDRVTREHSHRHLHPHPRGRRHHHPFVRKGKRPSRFAHEHPIGISYGRQRPPSPSTRRVKRLWRAVYTWFPHAVNLGIFACRKIAGSDRFSEHAWFDAWDVASPKSAKTLKPDGYLDAIVSHIRRVGDRFITRIIYRDGGAHESHAHVDVDPDHRGMPPCARG